MKTAKLYQIFALAWLLLLCSAAVSAQPNMDPEEWLNSTMAEVTESVDLSEEQASAIRPLMAAEYEKRMELIAEARASGGGWQGMREKMQALQKDTDEQVAEILEEEQEEKWVAWRETVAERRRQRRGGN